MELEGKLAPTFTLEPLALPFTMSDPATLPPVMIKLPLAQYALTPAGKVVTVDAVTTVIGKNNDNMMINELG